MNNILKKLAFISIFAASLFLGSTFGDVFELTTASGYFYGVADSDDGLGPYLFIMSSDWTGRAHKLYLKDTTPAFFALTCQTAKEFFRAGNDVDNDLWIFYNVDDGTTRIIQWLALEGTP